VWEHAPPAPAARALCGGPTSEGEKRSAWRQALRAAELAQEITRTTACREKSRESRPHGREVLLPLLWISRLKQAKLAG